MKRLISLLLILTIIPISCFAVEFNVGFGITDAYETEIYTDKNDIVITIDQQAEDRLYCLVYSVMYIQCIKNLYPCNDPKFIQACVDCDIPTDDLVYEWASYCAGYWLEADIPEVMYNYFDYYWYEYN